MPLKKTTSFLIIINLLSSASMAESDSIILTRGQSSSLSSTNTVITGRSAHYTSFGREQNQYNLSWSRFSKGEHLTLCFPASWSIRSTKLSLLSFDELTRSTSDTRCKNLTFLESSGQSQLQFTTSTTQKLPQPILFDLEFSGVIAFEPAIYELDATSETEAYFYDPLLLNKIKNHVQQNDTEAPFYLPYSDTPKHRPSSLPSYGGGYDAYDPFNRKPPPVMPFPGVGSDITLSVIIPISMTMDSEPTSSPLVRVEIFSEPSAEPAVLILSHDEILTLHNAGTLINPQALLSYLLRKSQGIAGWFSLEEDLEDALNMEADDTNINERYINNLIASLHDLSITITPDNPANGSIAVNGILGAMMGDSSKQQQGITGRPDSSSNGSRQREKKSDSSESRQDINRDSGDGARQPPSQDSNELTVENSPLNIRTVLEGSDFQTYFHRRASYYLVGLYSHGQLTMEQLKKLFMYEAATKDYLLKCEITSDDLISILEQGDNTSQAKSLSVLRSLAESPDNAFFNCILTNTPSHWRDLIKQSPKDFESTEISTADQFSRNLAGIMLPYIASQSIFNALSRSGFIDQTHIIKKKLATHSLILLIVQNYDTDSDTYKEIIQKIMETIPALPIPQDFARLMGLPETLVEEEKKKKKPNDLIDSVSSEKPALKDIVATIKRYMLENGVTHETITYMEKFELFNEKSIELILKNGHLNENNLAKFMEATQKHVTAKNDAISILIQADYSGEAITALDSYLNPKTCQTLQEAGSDKASQVADEVTKLFKTFNEFLSSKQISHPKLTYKLGTFEQWDISDGVQASILQNEELVNSHGFETFIQRRAITVAENSFKVGSKIIMWDNEIDGEIADKAKEKVSIHDTHYQAFTGDDTVTSLTVAVKTMIKDKAKRLLKNKIRQKEKIDQGRESWCEWCMRIFLGE